MLSKNINYTIGWGEPHMHWSNAHAQDSSDALLWLCLQPASALLAASLALGASDRHVTKACNKLVRTDKTDTYTDRSSQEHLSSTKTAKF